MDNLNPRIKIYTAVGSIVIYWAFIEESISSCVKLLYHKCGGNNTKHCKKYGMPRTQLARKLNFLTEAFETLPQLIQYKDTGLYFISTIKELSKERDIIIHGVMTYINPQYLSLVKEVYDKTSKKENMPKLEYKKYSFIDLKSLENKILALVNEMNPFVLNLVRDFGHQ